MIKARRARAVSKEGIFVASVIFIGIVLRIVGVHGELWLDEIWTLSHVRSFSTPFQIFSLRTDNNHPINSIWLWYVGSSASSETARLLSLAASLWLVWDLCRAWREGVVSSMVVALISLSFPMILYGSEARGYSVMLSCLWLSWRVCHRGISSSSGLGISSSVTLLLAATVGGLAHGSFLLFYPALLVWALAESRNRFINILALLPGLVSLGAQYLLFYRTISHGTGPLKSTLQVVIDTLSVLGGGPETTEYSTLANSWALIAMFLVLCLMLFEIVALAKVGRREWIFFVVVILLMPMIPYLVRPPRVVFVRYFLPSMLMAMILLGGALQRIFNRDIGGQVVASILAFVILAGGMVSSLRLWQYARGDMVGALRFITSVQPDGEIVIGGENPFRDRLLIGFHLRKISGGERIIYQDRDAAQWRIVYNQDPYYTPPTKLEDGRFTLVADYPSAALSGTGVYLYRRRSS